MAPKHQPLQSLDDALARHDLPPVESYRIPSSMPNEALDVKDILRFKAASYKTMGIDRVSSRTTDSLFSHAIPSGDCGGVLEAVINNKTLDKADIRSETYCRRWSVDCSVYSWDKDPLSVEEDEHNQALKDFDVFKDTEVFTQVIQADTQQLDVFNRDYTPTGNRNHTVFETANASINERQFLDLLTLGSGDGWFHDSHIDTSLDILERAVNCQKHRIAICRMGQGTELYTIARNEQSRQNRLQTQYDKILTDKCKDKDFILVPISDGYKDAYKTGIEQALRLEAFKIELTKELKLPPQISGYHWSLLLVDCRYPIIRGRYFDSSCNESAGSSHQKAVDESNNANAARKVLSSMRMMLNHLQPGRFDESESLFELDPHCPNQGRENLSGREDGWGACGPFVWEISKEITQYIADCHEDPDFSNNEHINPHLPLGYQCHRNWDSARTRRAIWNLVLRELRMRRWLNRNPGWMDSVSGRVLRTGDGMAGWDTWLKGKGLDEMTFWDSWVVGSELAPQFGQPVKVGL